MDASGTRTAHPPGLGAGDDLPRFTRIVKSGAPSGRIVLSFARRRRIRQRAALESGEAVALLLPRGSSLRHGDLLAADTGRVIEVVAAPEVVSTVDGGDGVALARAAYHLGNRHVPVQVGDGWLRYAADHVLDDMLRGLGLPPTAEVAPFEPESGAYDHAH